MSTGLHLLRMLIREELEYYGKLMKTMGSSSSGEIEIDHRVSELQSVEVQIQQLEVTPLRMVTPEDTRKLDILKDRQAELEQEIKELQGIL